MPSIASSQFTVTVTTAIERCRPDWILPPQPRVDKAATAPYGYCPCSPELNMPPRVRLDNPAAFYSTVGLELTERR